jgi:DNA-binding GntR family transcriptional regulator
VELHLAREHAVSQSTVREALAKLEHAGFVQRIPNRGTSVTKLSPQEFREHLRLRLILEGVAAIEAARWMTKVDFEELDRRLLAISRAVSNNDFFELTLADLDFHRYIWERSGDKTLCRVLDQLTAPIFAFTGIRRSGARQDPKRVVLSHEPIVAALRAGDPAGVHEAIRVHIENSYEEFLNPRSSLDFQALAMVAT